MSAQFPVVIYGAGKVGSAFARALRRAGWPVELLAARGERTPVLHTGLLLLAVRDGSLPAVAKALARGGAIGPSVAVAHLSGALAPRVLAPLRRLGCPVAQAHPCLSFTDRAAPPQLSGASWVLTGDAAALGKLVALAAVLRMVPVEPKRLRRVPYHAAAALASNGTIALVDAAVQLLVEAGFQQEEALPLLLPLLESTLVNLRRQGLPGALSGPVRRGAVETVRGHWEALDKLPAHQALYGSLLRFQLPMAMKLGEAEASALEEIAALAGLPGPTNLTRPGGARRSRAPGK